MRVVLLALVLLALIGAGIVLGRSGLLPGATGPAATAAGGPSARAQADELLATGATDAAYEAYRAVVEDDPADVEAHRALTLIALLRQDHGAVALHGGEVRRLDPAGPAAAAVAAASGVLAAEDPEATAAAAAAARSVLEAAPSDLIALWAVTMAGIEGADPCGALPDIDAAIALTPRSYEWEELRLAAIGRAGDRTGAGEQLARMHAKFPGNAALSGWLLEWYEGIGDEAAAVALLREMAEGAGEDLAPRLRLAARIRLRQGDEAADAELARLAEGAEGTPLAAGLRMELAASLARQGRRPEATEVLEAVVAAPGTSPQQAHDAKVELARFAAASGNDEEAAALLDEVLSADPTHVGALKGKGARLIEAGAAREALAALNAALGQSPRDTDILLLLATAYELDGSDAMASDSLARAVELSEGGAEETERLARFLREQGRDATADALAPREPEEAPMADPVAAQPAAPASPQPLPPRVCAEPAPPPP